MYLIFDISHFKAILVHSPPPSFRFQNQYFPVFIFVKTYTSIIAKKMYRFPQFTSIDQFFFILLLPQTPLNELYGTN